MSTTRTRRRLAGVTLALVVAAAACAGGNDLDTAETTTTTEATTTTTQPATTTTAEEVTASTAPLTGRESDDPEALERPALFIKIDNHPDGRPQDGLEHADLVLEMLAEFQLSRFAAVFHSQAPDHVGPVRSSRTSDFDLLLGFGHPLYGSSGGNDHVLAAVRNLPVHNVTAYTRTEYYRDPSRSAPHNLYVDAADLFELAPDDAEPPTPWFSYRGEGDPVPDEAQPIDGEVTVRFGFPVSFTWDGERQGWLRSQEGGPHLNADGEQLAPTNVVILTAEYGNSPADAASPELLSVGEGDAVVLTEGHLLTGRWIRSSAEDPPALFADDGSEIALTPGQTWILYPQAGRVSY
jgi:hypothetical protein